MQVREKMPHIDVIIKGAGADIVKGLVIQHYPNADIKTDETNDDDYVKWEESDLYKEIKANKTPGGVLEAYRLREGLSIMELANLTGIKYTNISAMENNRRVIGLKIAKKLAKALHCDYTKFLK